MAKKKKKGLYKLNKEAKVGETIECPICHTKFTKRQYSQAFCSTRCKDKFWNSKGDRHRYADYPDDDFSDREMDEMYGGIVETIMAVHGVKVIDCIRQGAVKWPLKNNLK